jgi:hypothetical protein
LEKALNETSHSATLMEELVPLLLPGKMAVTPEELIDAIHSLIKKEKGDG